MFFDVEVLFLRRTLSCCLYDEMFYMNKVFYFLKYYCYDLAFNKSSYERTPNKVAVNSGFVWCIFGCKVTLAPCPNTFDPQKSNLFDECERSVLSSSTVHYRGPGTL